jgi:hypothetical protein
VPAADLRADQSRRGGGDSRSELKRRRDVVGGGKNELGFGHGGSGAVAGYIYGGGVGG